MQEPEEDGESRWPGLAGCRQAPGAWLAVVLGLDANQNERTLRGSPP